MEANLVQQRVSTITCFELYYGVARSNQSEAGRATVEEVLATMPLHPADDPVIRKAGSRAGELAGWSESIGDDVVIGAAAVVMEEQC